MALPESCSTVSDSPHVVWSWIPRQQTSRRQVSQPGRLFLCPSLLRLYFHDHATRRHAVLQQVSDRHEGARGVLSSRCSRMMQSQAATGNRSCQDRGHWKMGFFLGRSPFLLDCTRSYSTPFHHIHRDDNFMWQRRNDCRVPTHDSYCISCCSFDPVTDNYSVL